MRGRSPGWSRVCPQAGCLAPTLTPAWSQNSFSERFSRWRKCLIFSPTAAVRMFLNKHSIFQSPFSVVGNWRSHCSQAGPSLHESLPSPTEDTTTCLPSLPDSHWGPLLVPMTNSGATQTLRGWGQRAARCTQEVLGLCPPPKGSSQRPLPKRLYVSPPPHPSLSNQAWTRRPRRKPGVSLEEEAGNGKGSKCYQAPGRSWVLHGYRER